MLGKIFEQKLPLDEILMCSTPEFPQMYQYIDEKIIPWLEKHGHQLTVIGNARQTWNKWCYGTITRGKNKGRVRGFPLKLGMSWCTRELKVYEVDRYLRNIPHIRYLGIAVDEKKRIRDDPNIIYPLVEAQMTEADCLQWIKDNDLYNPLYDYFSRLGCWLCPKQTKSSVFSLIENFPDLWQKLKEEEARVMALNPVIDLWNLYGTAYYEDEYNKKVANE